MCVCLIMPHFCMLIYLSWWFDIRKWLLSKASNKVFFTCKITFHTKSTTLYYFLIDFSPISHTMFQILTLITQFINRWRWKRPHRTYISSYFVVTSLYQDYAYDYSWHHSEVEGEQDFNIINYQSELQYFDIIWDIKSFLNFLLWFSNIKCILYQYKLCKI